MNNDAAMDSRVLAGFAILVMGLYSNTPVGKIV
jgi:hypothetical protein